MATAQGCHPVYCQPPPFNCRVDRIGLTHGRSAAVFSKTVNIFVIYFVCFPPWNMAGYLSRRIGSPFTNKACVFLMSTKRATHPSVVSPFVFFWASCPQKHEHESFAGVALAENPIKLSRSLFCCRLLLLVAKTLVTAPTSEESNIKIWKMCAN